MKHGGIILGLLLLLIASVGILIYLWTQVPMSIPLAFLLWALVFGIFALVGGIAWLVGCHERRKAETVTAKLNFNPTNLFVRGGRSDLNNQKLGVCIVPQKLYFQRTLI